MSLPDLINYETPSFAGTVRATWVLDPQRAALLVHDMQRYFLRPYAPGCPALDAAIGNTAALLAAARAAGVPVYFTAQNGEQNQVTRGLQSDLWGPGMDAVTEHTDIIAELAPRSGETVLVKHRYSAFAHSDLAEQLAAGGRDQLVITGVYAHIGVTATALDAFMREVHPFVVADAVADFSPEQHAAAMTHLASCAAVVADTASVLTGLTGPGAAALPASDPGEMAGDPVGDLADGEFAATVADALAAVRDEGFAVAALAEPDADLFALGLNSLQAFELMDRIVDQTGIDVDYADFTSRPTVRFLVQSLVGAERPRVSL